jgi:hypothetical protein
MRAPSRAITELTGSTRLNPNRLSARGDSTRDYTNLSAMDTTSARRSTTAAGMASPARAMQSPSKRFFGTDRERDRVELAMAGGAVGDRLSVGDRMNGTERYSVGSMGSQGDRLSVGSQEETGRVTSLGTRTPGRRVVGRLRESVELDGGRMSALKRAEAATERLFRR